MNQNSKIVAFALTTAIAGTGCAGFSLQTMTSGPGDSGSNSSAPSQSRRTSSASGPDSAVTRDVDFSSVDDEANKQNARDFKNVLRKGKLSKLFPDGEVFAQVEALCGTKVWDRCLVHYEPDGDDLGWKQYTIRVMDSGEVYAYPEMYFPMAERVWATTALERIRSSGYEQEDTLIEMVKERCGDPIDQGCEVRAYGSNLDYRLTVRDSGEVIEVMETLGDWLADL